MHQGLHVVLTRNDQQMHPLRMLRRVLDDPVKKQLRFAGAAAAQYKL
jgi:hypothetical protein